MDLEWILRDGDAFLDLSGAGAAGEGLYLAVRPLAEEGYWRPVCVLVPGEDEREIGDGVLGREHAQDAVVKYAIQALSGIHGVEPTTLRADEDDPWPARTVAALWAVLASAPHTA